MNICVFWTQFFTHNQTIQDVCTEQIEVPKMSIFTTVSSSHVLSEEFILQQTIKYYNLVSWHELINLEQQINIACRTQDLYPSIVGVFLIFIDYKQLDIWLLYKQTYFIHFGNKKFECLFDENDKDV